MTLQGRPPAPVIAAAVMFELGVLVVLVSAVVGIFQGFWPLVLLAAMAAFAGVSAAQGLWRGWRGSRIFLMLVGGLLVPAGLSVHESSSGPYVPGYGLFGLFVAAYGVVMAVLLVVPGSSRAWFAVRPAPPRTPR
ncbi:hypothetical protein ACBI99_28860 [Nonomuraea sp. ATR24]|uniref:hypothetical protein n=1 Tax=Nonomuraea TaxID=83681 RepID=UPI001C5F3936|nr:hypothetical protein [Nonomuraea ceibae]